MDGGATASGPGGHAVTGGYETLDVRFGEAAHGVRWALGQVPDGWEDSQGINVGFRRLRLVVPDRDIGDSFEVAWSDAHVSITAGSAVGTVGALLEVARQVQAGSPRDVARPIRFKTRVYKHEVQFEAPATEVRGAHVGLDRPITRYSDAFIEAFFQQVVSRHFNAVCVYSGYHPFEWFLDYEGFEHATDKPADLRRRNFQALSRFYQTAKRYGLRTFLHHYVSHFTQALADHLQLGISEKGTRLAAFDHPMIDEYNRYIYRRTFETIPALDGLYMNFESSGDAIPFMRRTLLEVANGLTKKPVLFFRLWGVTDVEGMKQLLGEYAGPKGLIHKSHETNDVYYYPVADDRVKVWKKAIPGIEFTFSVGPCHNCGTNISQKLWTDPDYVHALLTSIQEKGADSISCQSSRELLLPFLPDADIFPQAERDHARMNVGHVEAIVDYVRSQTPTRKDWARRYAAWYGVDEKAGEAIRRAIVESSQIILKQYRQFCYGSAQEGYLYPGRFSHYQEPFFYYPMSFLNRIGEIPHNTGWRSWAIRSRPVKVVPEDTQAIIDYVNPAVQRRPANHPLAMARQIQGHIAASLKAIEQYRKLAGEKADGALVAAVQRNANNGQRIRREILIGIELYSCYFARSKAAFFRHLRKARQIMLDAVKVLGENLRDTDRFCSTTSSGPFSPERDAAEIEAIVKHEKDEFPFKALQAYLKSHERYNEIRRLCRPYVSVREEMAKRNLKLLKESLEAAEQAASGLVSPRYALYRDNVMAWVEYVRAEIDWLTPPAMACRPDEQVAPNESWRRMVHDQCYRWGERCWEDFASFFARQNFFREDEVDCRATYTAEGLRLWLREHGIDWAERKATWDANRGTVNQNGFLRIFIDPKDTGSRILHYTVWFEGCGGTRSEFIEYPNGHIYVAKPTHLQGCRMQFNHTDSDWRFDIMIPWDQLGGKPKPGDGWRLNVLSNPAVKRNRQVAWCQGYEYHLDVARLGTIVFE
jgi:hypothetical protein